MSDTTAVPSTKTLPAYLRRRNGRLELVLHCTWCQDYDLCAQKFWLRYGEQVEGTGPKPALNYGGAVHEALRLRYSQLGLTLTDVETVQMDALQGWFDACPQQADEWRSCGRAQDLIRAYNEWSSTGNVKGGNWEATAPNGDRDWEVLAVEEGFEVLVGEIEAPADVQMSGQLTIFVYLVGRKDLVVAWHGGLWVVDHKTASDWGSGDSNSHLDEGRMSFQFRGYAWAERERQRMRTTDLQVLREIAADSYKTPVRTGPMLSPRLNLPLLGTVGNYFISRKPYASDRKPANGRPPLPRNQFHQECYPFSATTLDEWRGECLGMAAEILRSHAAGYWRRKRNACGHWGRCEFYDLCEAAPEQRAGMLGSTLFQPKLIEREL